MLRLHTNSINGKIDDLIKGRFDLLIQNETPQHLPHEREINMTFRQNILTENIMHATLI